jgi:hypothetical protein
VLAASGQVEGCFSSLPDSPSLILQMMLRSKADRRLKWLEATLLAELDVLCAQAVVPRPTGRSADVTNVERSMSWAAITQNKSLGMVED